MPEDSDSYPFFLKKNDDFYNLLYMDPGLKVRFPHSPNGEKNWRKIVKNGEISKTSKTLENH